MRVFDYSPKDIETVVLSHGHFDHTTGLDGLVRVLGRANLPLLIHPEFWNRRRIVIPGRDPFELPSTSKSALQGLC
jgi:7,8-dihydropterin-6-yl-methyl-4-(beta-D-ribofuranosyl)aminobenzene 5'-phosphate synthase